MKLQRPVALVILAILCTAPATSAAEREEIDSRDRIRENWRRDALESMRVAPSEQLISDAEDLRAYQTAGFNTLVVFDVNGYNESGTAWNFKNEEQVRAETAFARRNGMPLVLGLAVEAFAPALSANKYAWAPIARRRSFAPSLENAAAQGLIPAASDDEIRARIQLWKKHGDDVVVGVFPWYDDVFLQNVDVDRQGHVYRLIKSIARHWFVFGMIGEFGFIAGEAEVARLYNPAHFDHLIVLMYPFNVGTQVVGFPLDNVASSDPDGDIARYVQHYLAEMTAKFFSKLRRGQLILLVIQAFYYPGEPQGRIPRPQDIEIMTRSSKEQLRRLPGQDRNDSAGYFYWGGKESVIVGLSQRPDWLGAAASVNDDLERHAGSLETEMLPTRSKPWPR